MFTGAPASHNPHINVESIDIDQKSQPLKSPVSLTATESRFLSAAMEQSFFHIMKNCKPFRNYRQGIKPVPGTHLIHGVNNVGLITKRNFYFA
ncbi:hypothetical protein D3C80_1822570 [compost metagenome]